jgi:transketolase
MTALSLPPRTMRDVLIARIAAKMKEDPRVYFLTADLGAPALDAMRDNFPGRCINVGIAEQNMINVATGLALEGNVVFAYGIAPFVSMRCFEQLRTTIALLSETRSLNVNILSIGAGFSYDVSGPTHHCPEDIPLLRLLPNVDLFSPADWVTADAFLETAMSTSGAKYFRLEGKPIPALYAGADALDFSLGFAVRATGSDTCLVTTGYATHMGERIRADLAQQGTAVGHVDLFLLKRFDEAALARALAPYQRVVVIQEAFSRRGGLDNIVGDLLVDHGIPARLLRYGLSDRYFLGNGDRNRLHREYGMDVATITRALSQTA